MATKAQKRAAALAKREAFLKEERERGLAALEASRKRHTEKMNEALRKADERVKIDKKMTREEVVDAIMEASFEHILDSMWNSYLQQTGRA